MANRFYIPPGRNPGIDYANLALGLMQTYQRGKIAKGYQDVARERTAVAERGQTESERVGKIRFGEEGKPGLEQRRVGALEQTAQTRRDELPWHLRPVNPQKWAVGKAKLTNMGMDKAMQPIMQIADMALNNKMSRADLYATYKSSPLAFKEAEQNLQKELQGAMKKGDEVKAAQITEMIGWMAEPQSFLDASFPGVRQELEGTTKMRVPEKLYETEEGWQPRSEAIGKLKPEKPVKPFETPKDKRTIEERRRLEDDIIQIQIKIANLQSGQDIMSEALGSEREAAISDLQKRLSTMNTQYEKLGGNLSRVGGALETTPAPTTKPDQAVDVKVGTVIINDKTGERKRWNGKKWAPIK